MWKLEQLVQGLVIIAFLYLFRPMYVRSFIQSFWTIYVALPHETYTRRRSQSNPGVKDQF